MSDDATILREALIWILQRARKDLHETGTAVGGRGAVGHHCDYRAALHGIKDKAKRALGATRATPRPPKAEVESTTGQPEDE